VRGGHRYHSGAPVVQTQCDATSKAQWWSRIYVSSAWEQWVNVASLSTYPYIAMYLDVIDGRNANGTKLQVWRCTNTVGMYWRVAYARHGHYSYPYNMHTNVGTGTPRGMCLDVPAGSLVDGEQLQIWPCTTDTMNLAQLWLA
jgi:hypothetical protein